MEKEKKRRKVLEAVRRANVYQYANMETRELHFVSRNITAALTDEEKAEIAQIIKSEDIGFEVVFDN